VREKSNNADAHPTIVAANSVRCKWLAAADRRVHGFFRSSCSWKDFINNLDVIAFINPCNLLIPAQRAL